MSTRVLRWTCPIDDLDHDLPVPPGAVVRVAGEPFDRVEFWALGSASLEGWDTPADPAVMRSWAGPTRVFRVFGTGQTIPAGYVYRGTTERTAHGLVWHLLERVPGGQLVLPADATAEVLAAVRRAVRAYGGHVDVVRGDR